MPSALQKIGQQGEQKALRHLRAAGYRILARNYRTPFGEIDIIARDATHLVFVEVKQRNTGKYGSPKQAVTRRKQERLARAARIYLKNTGQSDCRARFDVVALGPQTVEIIKNAFGLPR